MEDRDRRRWQAADENNDGNLDKLEFKHFLHPEESHHMRDVVINETISDLDKNGDGLISLVSDNSMGLDRMGAKGAWNPQNFEVLYLAPVKF